MIGAYRFIDLFSLLLTYALKSVALFCFPPLPLIALTPFAFSSLCFSLLLGCCCARCAVSSRVLRRCCERCL